MLTKSLFMKLFIFWSNFFYPELSGAPLKKKQKKKTDNSCIQVYWAHHCHCHCLQLKIMLNPRQTAEVDWYGLSLMLLCSSGVETVTELLLLTCSRRQHALFKCLDTPAAPRNGIIPNSLLLVLLRRGVPEAASRGVPFHAFILTQWQNVVNFIFVQAINSQSQAHWQYGWFVAFS